MSVNFWVSIATAVITGIFAIMVFTRYLNRRRWYLFAWSVGLTLYSVGALAQALLFDNFDTFLFKLWYWAGALALTLWLGQGSVFLLVQNKKRAWANFAVVLVLMVVSLAYIAAAGVDPSVYRPEVELTDQYGEIFTATGSEKTIRTILAITTNTYGTLMLVGGAAYSAYQLWRKNIMPNRMWGNLLILAGGLMPALGGTLILLGSPTFKYLGELFGGVLMFTGFLVTTREAPTARPAVKETAST
jgi:hypothetical protein